MSQRPLVSVLVAAYNAERWIGDALASAVGQTYAWTEVVVVDDGSTDGTLAIARRFEGPRVKVVRQPNRGAQAARNAALALAQGDYIQYLDADDVLDTRKVEAQVRRLDGEPPDTVASSSWVRFYGAPPGPGDALPERPDWRDYEPTTDWLIQVWLEGGMMPPFAWLTPRALIERAGPWDESLRRNQDGEFFARVLAGARRIAFCREARGYYRSGMKGSVSQQQSPSAVRSYAQSVALCERHLLAVRDTPAARRACASLWQTVAFDAHPADRALVREAEGRVRALGGGARQPDGGPLFRLIRDTVGWKPAVRLQKVRNRLLPPRPPSRRPPSGRPA